ncbi:MAG: hypothetical protein V3V15_07330 [Sphingorhabdus sp.]
MSRLGDTAKNAKAKAQEGLSSARETGAAAKRKAGEYYDRGRDAAARGAQSSKDMAHKAKVASGETIERNPLAAVVGGLALGAIIGALLPKSEREQKALGKTGKKMNDRAKNAASAAKEAGKARMAEVGLDADNAREQFKDVFGRATEAAKAAGKAATEAARKGK